MNTSNEELERRAYFTVLSANLGNEISPVWWWLFKHNFYWVNPMDENRELGARSMRRQLIEDNRINESDLGPVNVLEVLVYMALEMDKNSPFEPSGPQPWLNEMLSNLGILGSDDECFVAKRIDDWLSGEGPTPWPKIGGKGSNVREFFEVVAADSGVEMWYQMHFYMIERYWRNDF